MSSGETFQVVRKRRNQGMGIINIFENVRGMSWVLSPFHTFSFILD